MKTRLAAFLIVAIVVPGCFRDTPRPNTTFAPGNETTLKAARLSGRQEVPPNASAGTADATVVIDPSRMIVTVTVNFTGLVDTTDAHIHVGGVGQDGPIILPLASGGFTSPLVVSVTQDDFTPQTGQGVATFADALNAIQQGRTYVNLHTTAFPEGEIRGQVGPVTMLAQLDGQQEVPPVVTTATGSMSLTLNNDQSAMTFSLDATGLSNLTEAHIHAGAVGVDGPIIFPLAAGAFTFPLTGTLTEADLTPQPGVTTFPEAVDAVLSGLTYANIHTALYPDGEIRGQILPFLPTNPPPAPVPPITTPPTTITSIPGYPNTATTSLGIPSQGFPNTGVVVPSSQSPGLTTPGFSNAATTTTGTATSTTAPPVTIVNPVYRR
jgi:hypothetical protein